MKMGESEKIVLVSCIIDFDDVQVWSSVIEGSKVALDGQLPIPVTMFAGHKAHQETKNNSSSS